MNNIARIGTESIETNASLRQQPIGIGAALAHITNALKPADVRAMPARILGLEEQDHMLDEPEPCRDYGRDSRDPNYEPGHDMEFQGEADGTSFYRCRKCGKQEEM